MVDQVVGLRDAGVLDALQQPELALGGPRMTGTSSSAARLVR